MASSADFMGEWDEHLKWIKVSKTFIFGLFSVPIFFIFRLEDMETIGVLSGIVVCNGRPLFQAWLLPDLNTIPNDCVRESFL